MENIIDNTVLAPCQHERGQELIKQALRRIARIHLEHRQTHRIKFAEIYTALTLEGLREEYEKILSPLPALERDKWEAAMLDYLCYGNLGMQAKLGKLKTGYILRSNP